MIKKTTTLLLLLATNALILYADNIIGRVTFGDSGEPAAGAIVSVRSGDGKVLGFVYTDNNGEFSLDVKEGNGTYVEVSYLGYKSITLRSPLPARSDIALEPTSLELNETVVAAPTVTERKDTITYSVPALMSKNDRALSDVLKKIPGIEVDRKGYVKYMGMPISRLYIEGNDLLESKYNLATVNLDPEYLGSIQILERHQPLKVLENFGERPQNAAINITLKQGVKNQVMASLEAQGGISTGKPQVPYAADGYLMSIGRKFQTMTTLATDAAGNDIIRNVNTSDIIKDLIFSRQYRIRDYLSISSPSAPLNRERTMFNTSYSGNSSNKVVLKEGYTLGISVDYENLALTSESRDETIYFDDEGSVLARYSDIYKSRSGQWYGAADLKFEINTSRLFLRERLAVSMSGLGADNSISGTSAGSEHTGDRNIDVLNGLRFTTKTKSGRAAVSMSMLTQYSDKSETLRITSDYKDGTEKYDALQSIGSRIFNNDIFFSTTYILGERLQLTSYTDINLLYRDFRTALTGIGGNTANIFDGTAPSSSSRMIMLKPYESLRLTYSMPKFKVSAGADLRYTYYHYMSTDAHRVASSPKIYMEYEPTARFRIQASGGYSLSEIDEQQLFGGIIMNDYRDFTTGRTELLQTPSWNASLTLHMRDPMSGWYVRGYASYIHTEAFEITRFVTDDYTVSSYSNQTSPMDAVSAGMTVEKGILSNGSKVTARLDFTQSESELSQNDITIPYQFYSGTASLAYNGSPVKWMNIAYSGSYSLSRYRSDKVWSQDFVHNFSQRLSITFFLFNRFEAGVSCEHYLSKYDTPDAKQTILLDCSAGYNITNDIRVFINARNLLDQSEYIYSYISPLRSFTQTFAIRPLNVLAGLSVRF